MYIGPKRRDIGENGGRDGRIGRAHGAVSTRELAGSIQYAPQGAIQSMTLGVVGTANPGWTESWSYNNRLQPTSMSVSTGALSLAFSYCPNGAASCGTNNGNLLRQVITRQGTVWTEDYPSSAYDGMNRLTSAQETSAAGNCTEGYDHDRYGNHWVASNGCLDRKSV